MAFNYERKTINGELFRKMIFSGAACLHRNSKKVDDLNVFPIPDGDTGENMYLTMQGGLDRLIGEEDTSLTAQSGAMASGMIMGARGNSGVILSQLFCGLAEGLKGVEDAGLNTFVNALRCGVKSAYGAVIKPVEGTILTVAREACEAVASAITAETTVARFFEIYYAEMKQSLMRTPELLAVLKEAGVIDSGGAGLLYITEGFLDAANGKETEEVAATLTNSAKSLDFSKFNENSVMEFGYCTELLLQLQTAKTDIDAFSVSDLISFLETLGDSIAAFRTGSVIKIHVHTMTPWMVLQHCQQYGEFLTVKIENMTLQHNETVKEEQPVEKEEDDSFLHVKKARKKFGLVTVASGDGMKEIFLEMGADAVVSGGQTNNPSAEDFVDAFDEVNADIIFVLPNNGNIVMAAKQAAKVYAGSEVRVIESKNIGQGYSAISMLDYASDDADVIEELLRDSMKSTQTGMVSVSVRNTSLNGVEVKQGEYMGFTDHTMIVSTPNKVHSACALAAELGVKDKEYLIVVYGKDADENERMAFSFFMGEAYPDLELYEIDGGQEVYDFVLIVE